MGVYGRGHEPLYAGKPCSKWRVLMAYGGSVSEVIANRIKIDVFRGRKEASNLCKSRQIHERRR